MYLTLKRPVKKGQEAVLYELYEYLRAPVVVGAPRVHVVWCWVEHGNQSVGNRLAVSSGGTL